MILFPKYLLSGVAFFMGCFLLPACENDINKVNQLGLKKVGIEEAKDVSINYTIGGHTKAILQSKLMLNVQEAVPYVEFPKSLHTDFFNEAGLLESKMDAKYGKYKQYQSNVLLRDSIVVINVLNGDTLVCDELNWDRNRVGVEFYTDKPVMIRTKTEIIDGIGMESSQDFKNWHILQTTGRISVPASKFPQ